MTAPPGAVTLVTVLMVRVASLVDGGEMPTMARTGTNWDERRLTEIRLIRPDVTKITAISNRELDT